MQKEIHATTRAYDAESPASSGSYCILGLVVGTHFIQLVAGNSTAKAELEMETVLRSVNEIL